MKVLDKIEEAICIICLLAMTTLVFANVFSRYVLHLSLSFSEEITTNLFVLLSMMGTAIAARRRAHLGLSILTDAVSPKLRRAMLIFGFGLATVFPSPFSSTASGWSAVSISSVRSHQACSGRNGFTAALSPSVRFS